MIVMAVILICCASTVLSGDLSENIWINGFGHESYMSSQENNYIVSNSTDGSYNDYVIGLTFTAKINQKAYVRSQIVNDEDGIRLDWGFGEYRLNDHVNFMFGKVRFSDRLYTKTMDVKALQPFTYLPSGVYSTGINAFVGFGVDLSAETDQGWGVELNLCAGSGENKGAGGGSLEDLRSGSIHLFTPVNGLIFSFSHVYVGDIVGGMKVKDYIYGTQYQAEKFFVEGEYKHLNLGGTQDAWYVQGGYQVHPMIRPVVRYSKYEQEEDMMTSTYALTGKTLDQKEIGLGVNFFISKGVILKIEHHIIEGSGNLIQDGYSVDMATGMLTEDPDSEEYGNLYPDDNWSLTSLQMSFMF